ncbi:unnamed protein product, partial [Rotaria magnacalcarata]
MDINVSFDKIIQQIVDQIKREREDFHECYEKLEKEYNRMGRENELLRNLNTEIYQESLHDQNKKEFINDQSISTSADNSKHTDIVDSQQNSTAQNSNIQSLSLEESNIFNIHIDRETQTDNQHQDKLLQINNKLKHALQTIKEKMHQV